MTTDHFEFAPARKMIADLLQTADRCRLERIAQIDRVMTGMRETLKRAEDTVRTCPAEIAKLEAERDALIVLTPEAAAREMLLEVPAQEGPPGPPSVKDFDPTRHEGGAAGVLCLHFAWIPLAFFAHHTLWETPIGTQMGSAGVLALASQMWRPVGATWAEVKAKSLPALPDPATQPTNKPTEDEDPVEVAYWRFRMLTDKTQKTARVKARYLEEPYPERDAFKIAVRSKVLGLQGAGRVEVFEEPFAKKAAEPAPPALLDLRTVRMDSEHAKPDTLIADADLYDTGRNPIEHHASVERGEKFTVERVAADHGHGPRVKVLLDGGSGVFIAAMQPAHIKPGQDEPARVVKHACPRCDEGMREIEFIKDLSWPDGFAVKAGSLLRVRDVTAGGVNLESSNHGISEGPGRIYRFVRADVPPPSEWCDGKGVG